MARQLPYNVTYDSYNWRGETLEDAKKVLQLTKDLSQRINEYCLEHDIDVTVDTSNQDYIYLLADNGKDWSETIARITCGLNVFEVSIDTRNWQNGVDLPYPSEDSNTVLENLFNTLKGLFESNI